MSTEKINPFLFLLSRFPKRPIVFASDLALTLLAVYFVLWIDSTTIFEPLPILSRITTPLCFLLCVQAVCYWSFGLYRGVWRFASMPDLMRIIKACMVAGVILILSRMLLGAGFLLPRFSLTLFCLLAICMLSGSRLTYRWYKDNRKVFKTGKKVLVIGAGSAGESILRELKRKANMDFLPVGLIDDNPAKIGLEIHGIRVLGNTSKLAAIVQEKEVELILIAIPTANTAQMRRVVNLCEQTQVPYRTLPSFNDIASGQASINSIRPVLVEDLLSRDPIQFNKQQLQASISDKVILVTGAGGSIGSELCRKIAEYTPRAMILVEHSEFNLFQIQTQLEQQFPALTLHCFLVSVTNHEAINQMMRQHKPDYVFHAAAYKHVPLLEPQIRVALDNNVFGTQIVANAAADNQVKKFILVSTDKAVNPKNVMGATKRCAEIICQCLNQTSDTRFITVRFGNVLGSTGSVVPLFKQQIANGGPVTVTHPDMERYFMTIQEAAQLITQTVTIENPSDLYVLDMGEPVKIQYLAEQMIKLSGHRPNVDIKITYSGLRPGEKINEELFYDYEKISSSDHEKIIRVQVPAINATHYMRHLTQLKRAYFSHDENLKDYLFNLASAEWDAMPIDEEVAAMPALKNIPMSLAMEYLN